MDASNRYRWRAHTSPVNAQWPAVPSLLEDEIISSWLVRCALKHGCEPTTLTNDVWPGYRIWCSDPDRGLSSERLDVLSDLSGMTSESLQASTLMPVHRSITGDACFAQGAALWFLCLGVRNRRRCGGLQYCPRCFAEDEPYYRIQGRLAWHTCCPIHKVILLDRCENCHAPLCPHLVKPPKEDIGHCHRCAAALSKAIVQPESPDAAAFQTSTDGLFGGRTQQYGDVQLDLCAWFELAHWMLGILRSAVRSANPCISCFFENLQVHLDTLHQPSTGLRFELLSPVERANLLSDVWKMISVGPERLISAATQYTIRSSLLMPRSCRMPVALDELALVLQARQRGMSGHIHPDTPRSPASVLMRWNRLLRKFQR